MSETYQLSVNGITYPVSADVGRNLSGVLREELGLTGTKEGCDDCECGAAVLQLGRRRMSENVTVKTISVKNGTMKT